MARGGKRNFKGRGKSFTNPEALERDRIKQEKEKAWRRQRGIETDSSEEDSDEEGDSSGNEASGSDGSDDGITFAKEEGAAGGAAAGASGSSKTKKAHSKKAAAAAESSSEEDSDSDDDQGKRKGVEGLIEVANPNAPKRNKKVSQLDTAAAEKAEKPQLSRREREEIEKQRAKARYQKLHAEGKTDEARADLARLAIIRKQREEAAAKRKAEQTAKEDAAKSKQAEVSKAIGRRK